VENGLSFTEIKGCVTCLKGNPPRIFYFNLIITFDMSCQQSKSQIIHDFLQSKIQNMTWTYHTDQCQKLSSSHPCRLPEATDPENFIRIYPQFLNHPVCRQTDKPIRLHNLFNRRKITTTAISLFQAFHQWKEEFSCSDIPVQVLAFNNFPKSSFADRFTQFI